jgi:hypothetical protein
MISGRVPPVCHNLFFVVFVHFVIFVIIKAGTSRTNWTFRRQTVVWRGPEQSRCGLRPRFSTKVTKIAKATKLQYEPAKPFFEQSMIKIHQQPEAAAAQPHIGKYLRLVDRKQSFDGFDFYYDQLVYDQVGTEAARQANALINQRQNDLPIHKEISLLQLPEQTLLIDFYQKPRPEHPMNLYGQADDVMGWVPPVRQNLFFFVAFVHFVTFVIIKAGTSRTNRTNDSEIGRTKNLPGP